MHLIWEDEQCLSSGVAALCTVYISFNKFLQNKMCESRSSAMIIQSCLLRRNVNGKPSI